MTQITEKDIVYAILIAVGIVFVFFVYANFIPKSSETSATIVEITAQEDLFDTSLFTQNLENVIIKSQKTLDYQSKEAQELIKKYNLKKIPSLIITSKKIDSINLPEGFFEIKGNSAVLINPVPYLDLNTGEIKGNVAFIEIQAKDCKECTSLSYISDSLKQMGIKVGDYEITFSEDIIKENNLTNLPSLLISKDIDAYWWFFPQIKSSFDEKKDYYLLNLSLLPYKEIKTGIIKGLVEIKYLKDNSCLDCFNVEELKSSLQSLGIYINNERSIDVSSSEGQEIIKKYNITAVPTVILSKEINDYKNIKQTLEQVGTFELDSFVFRKLDALDVKYKNIGG